MKVTAWWDDYNNRHFHKVLELPIVFPDMELFLLVKRGEEVKEVAFKVTSFIEYREKSDRIVVGIEANDYDPDEIIEILAASDWISGEP